MARPAMWRRTLGYAERRGKYFRDGRGGRLQGLARRHRFAAHGNYRRYGCRRNCAQDPGRKIAILVHQIDLKAFDVTLRHFNTNQ